MTRCSVQKTGREFDRDVAEVGPSFGRLYKVGVERRYPHRFHRSSLRLSSAEVAYLSGCGLWREVLGIKSEDYTKVISEFIMASAC